MRGIRKRGKIKDKKKERKKDRKWNKERQEKQERVIDKHSLIYALHGYGRLYIYTASGIITNTDQQRIHRKDPHTIHYIYN